MTPTARAVAASAAADMALAVLQASRSGRADAEQFGGGFYTAAKRLIAHDCTDPDLTPERVAMGIGLSRASLYRIFAKHDESVAAVIWSSRIERSWRMLTTSEGVGMLVSDIAFHCGFRELPTFTRMFRRRYGMAPRDAREQGALNS